MIYLVHHLIALVLGAGLIALLLHGRWAERTPGRAIALWHCALLTVWGATAGMIFGPIVIIHDRGIVPALIESARTMLDAPLGEPILAALPGVLFMIISVAVVTGCWIRLIRRRRRLRQVLDLVGGEVPPAASAVQIDSSTPTAWCLPGWRPRIVITSATAELLSAAELRAVLRHERAHLRQRHDLALLPLQALRTVLPRSSLAATLHRRVQLLTEMLADDHALKASRRADLARALTVLGGTGSDPTPAGALGMTTGSGATTKARLARIQQPVPATPTPLRWALLVAATALSATPISLFLLPG